MRVLGLTGSIGMGKSTTAKLFAEAGVPVYDADAEVHALYEKEAVPLIGAVFPDAVVDGRVDRARLSRAVVGNPDAMARLEAIVHPLVRAREVAFIADAEKAGAEVAVLDVPLLFETGGEKRVDAVVVVSAPADVQRARLLAREGMTTEKLEALLVRQMRDEEKRRRADFVVDSSRGLEPVRERIAQILGEIAKMPQRRA